MCSTLIIKTPERHQWRYGVFIVNFEHISHLFLVFLRLRKLLHRRFLPWQNVPKWKRNLHIIFVSNVCVSPGYFSAVFFTIVMYLNSRFFNQFLLFRLWLVIVSIVSRNFVAIVFSSIFLYWYSHSCYNQKSKFVKTLFVNLMTVAVFYCRYVIDKDVVESFYKESLFLVEYSLSIYTYIYIHNI